MERGRVAYQNTMKISSYMAWVASKRSKSMALMGKWNTRTAEGMSKAVACIAARTLIARRMLIRIVTVTVLALASGCRSWSSRPVKGPVLAGCASSADLFLLVLRVSVQAMQNWTQLFAPNLRAAS